MTTSTPSPAASNARRSLIDVAARIGRAMRPQHDGDEDRAEHEQEDVGKRIEGGRERHDADEDQHPAHELGVRDAGFHR